MTDNETITKIINDKPNSFETGKASSRHKIYYNTPEELLAHIQALENLGLYKEEEIKYE